MSPEALAEILREVRDGRMEVAEALRSLTHLPYRDLGFAKLDHHRHLRTGYPEVVFGEGKSREQIEQSLRALHGEHGRAMATRVCASDGPWLAQALPFAEYYQDCRLLTVGSLPEARGHVVVVCAGTTDLPVAREAQMALAWLGSRCELLVDVGVAGLHRLLDNLEVLRRARVVVAVAGMDAALASVVAGLVSCPVIACPTSVGYGSAFAGLAPLLSMLNSCAAGVSVVNIDNGFGAACAAHGINRMESE